MNLIDSWVVKVLSNPYLEYGKWWVDVFFENEGGNGRTSLMFNTEEECKEVCLGYKFLS